MNNYFKVDKEIRIDGGKIVGEGPLGTKHLLGSGERPVCRGREDMAEDEGS